MKQTPPLITIIVPVHNRAGIVVRTLDSIAAQTCRDIRLIIVDNASTDSTPEVIAKWKSDNESAELQVDILHEPIPGAPAARNCGLTATESEYVMFFDSDDVMLPDHIERIHNYLIRFPDTDILRWDMGIIDSDGWLNVKRQHHPDELRLHILHSSLSTMRFTAKTSIVRDCGGWDNDLSVWNDLELGVRLLLTARTVRKLHGEPTVTVYPTEKSITGTSYSSRRSGHKVAMDKIKGILNTDEHRTYMLIAAAKQAMTAALYRREGAAAIAREAFKEACTGLGRRHRAALRLIYLTVKITGHGGAALTDILFPYKAPKM